MTDKSPAGTLLQTDDMKSKYRIVLSCCRLLTEAQSALDRSIQDFCAAAEASQPNLALEASYGKPPTDAKSSIATPSADAQKSPEPGDASDDPDIAAGPAKKTKVKKDKPERDPDMPKRPMSAFLAFQAAVRAAVKSDMDAEARPSDVLKAVSEKWKELDEEGRRPYVTQYEESVRNYEERMAAYNEAKGITPKTPKKSSGKEKSTPVKEKMSAPNTDDDEAAASLIGRKDDTASPTKAPKKRVRKSEAKEGKKSKLSEGASESVADKKDKKRRKKSESATSP